MKVRDLYDPAFFMVRSLPPGDREVVHTEPPKRTEPVIIPAEDTYQPKADLSESERIVTAWREIMGVNLNVQTVENHLETLRRWHERLKRRSQ